MNGNPTGQLAASEVDRYIHFSVRKSLAQLHNDLITIIE